jgi:hypothetical protein
MRQPIVFDASALLALFEAEDTVFDLWYQAEKGQATVVFPAAAVAEGNVALRASYDAWSPVLWAKGVSVAPLDSSAAVGGYIVTRSPQAYAGAKVLVRVI